MDFVRTDRIDQVTTRNKDNDWVVVEPGTVYKFAQITGSGHVSDLWMTATVGKPGFVEWMIAAIEKDRLRDLVLYDNLDFLKNLILKISFDGHENPDVNVSVADFFGMGFGKYKQYDSRFGGMTSGGFYCNFEMPFNKSCKIEFVNNNLEAVVLYAEVTYHSHKVIETNYFRASYSKSILEKGKPYIMLDETGEGYYLGCNLYMWGRKVWKHLLFLEGDIRVFIDADEKPALNYTGTEDYFLGGWYFAKGEFAASDHGCTYKSWLQRKIAAYRFHPDKVNFSSGIRIEVDHGENNEVDGIYSSVVYWYHKEAV